MNYPSLSEQQRILKSFDISVIRRNEELFEARNSMKGSVYRLKVQEGKIMCECPDAVYRAAHCKHMYAVERALEVFKEAL